ncbi:uncharacterized protein O8D03_019736 [Erethizon dorsatum]
MLMARSTSAWMAYSTSRCQLLQASCRPRVPRCSSVLPVARNEVNYAQCEGHLFSTIQEHDRSGRDPEVLQGQQFLANCSERKRTQAEQRSHGWLPGSKAIRDISAPAKPHLNASVRRTPVRPAAGPPG